MQKNQKKTPIKLNLILTNSFEKDYKTLLKRGVNFDIFWNVVDLLIKNEKLPAQYKDHQLKGKYKRSRECHITSDLLLIYSKNKSELVLNLVRIGTHSDLFK